MKYIEAPDEYCGHDPAVFLAGGVDAAELWQLRLVDLLDGADITILNPRRRHFPAGDRSEAARQTAWEHHYLGRADVVAFWFLPPTLCPLTLFELGHCCAGDRPIVVGVDPHYARRDDVITQLRLHRPDVTVWKNLEQISTAIVHEIKKRSS